MLADSIGGHEDLVEQVLRACPNEWVPVGGTAGNEAMWWGHETLISQLFSLCMVRIGIGVG